LIQHDTTRYVIDNYILNTQTNSNIYQSNSSITSKRIFFNRIETVNKEGINIENFQFDESVYIKAALVVEDLDVTAKVSFTLQNNNSEYLSTFVEDLKFFYSNSKECQVLIKLPASLIAPNTYALRLAIFCPNGIIYDLVEMICPFRIIETGSKMALFEGINYGSFFMDYLVVK
jgi:lipopolysaccharide transport system ATP-binding protein